MKFKKQLFYNKKYILSCMVLGTLLLNISILLCLSVSIDNNALPKFVVFTTIMTIPLLASFSLISATSLAYLLERFPRLQVVTVSLFIFSYLDDFLDFEVVSVVTQLVGVISIIIFWRLKNTNVSTVICILFFISSVLTTIYALSSFYDSPLFYLSEDEGHKEETIDKIVYQTPSSYLSKIRQVHKNLPDSYKLLDAKVRVLEPDTIYSWMSAQFGKVVPRLSGCAIYKIWGKNIVFVELAGDELQLEKAIVHELTHIKQFERYGLRFFFQPQWKMEGQAVIAENCFSQEEIRSFLAEDLDIHPFKYKFLGYGVDDYKASQAQAWYYLKYLKFSEDEFFDSKTKLAPWDEVKKAFLEHSDS